MAGVQREDKRELELTAIIESIGWPEGDNEPDEERKLRYDYARKTMEDYKIRVLAADRLPDLAETARIELRV
jgi:hypothetical protein